MENRLSEVEQRDGHDHAQDHQAPDDTPVTVIFEGHVDAQNARHDQGRRQQHKEPFQGQRRRDVTVCNGTLILMNFRQPPTTLP